MTDCEHLIENAFAAYLKCGEDFEDFKESFDKEMALSRNKIMLSEVNMTVDELWR